VAVGLFLDRAPRCSINITHVNPAALTTQHGYVLLMLLLHHAWIQLYASASTPSTHCRYIGAAALRYDSTNTTSIGDKILHESPLRALANI